MSKIWNDEISSAQRSNGLTGHTLVMKIKFMQELAKALAEQVSSLEQPRTLDISRGIKLSEEMRRYEIEIIQSALKYTGGNQRAAARLLGLKATTLNAKIKHYDMQRSYSHIYRARQ
jgi:DNA-binding NtrC family response regulator